MELTSNRLDSSIEKNGMMVNLSKEDICRRYSSLEQLIEALDSCYDLYDAGVADQVTQNNYIELSKENALEVYRIFKKAHGDPNFQFEPNPLSTFKITPWEDVRHAHYIKTNATAKQFQECIDEAKKIEAFDLDTILTIAESNGFSAEDVTPAIAESFNF